MAVFRPDLYDVALGIRAGAEATRSIGACDGPDFDPNDIAGYLASFKISRQNSS
jgi:NitT/TauT family transport system ATP-binding protein